MRIVVAVAVGAVVGSAVVGSVGCATAPVVDVAVVTVAPRPPYVPSDRSVRSDAAQATLFAELALQKGDVPAAVVEWRAAVHADDTSPYLRVRLGEAQLMVGDAEGAIAAADVAVGLGKDGKDDAKDLDHVVAALRLRAVALGIVGDDAGAIAALRAALDTSPGEPRASSLLAKRLVAAGDLDGAEAVVAAWMNDAPGVRGTVELARVFAERGQIERAFIHLDAALEKVPDDELALITRRDLLMALGRYDEAVVTTRALLAALGDGPATRRAMIVTLGLAAPDDARDLATALLGEDDGERTRLLVADAFEAAGLLDDAAATLATPTTPSTVLRLERSRLALARHRPAEAAAICSLVDTAGLDARLADQGFLLCVQARIDLSETATAVDALLGRPGSPGARWLNRLASLVPQVDLATRAVFVKRAEALIAAADAADDVVVAAATVVAAAGDVAGADALLTALVDKRPADSALRFALARHRCTYATSDADVLAAVEAFEKNLPRTRGDDGDVDRLNFMAFALAERGLRSADARAFAWRAVLSEPGNGYVTDTWGWTLLHDGAVDEAVAVLRRAARLSPNEAEIWFHIAVAEVRATNDVAAAEAIAHAASLVAKSDPLSARIDVVAAALRSHSALPATP